MRYIIFYIAAALMLAGCAKETELDTGGGTTGEEGDVTVVMSLNVPCAATTRALNQTQEEAVHTVDILVFDKTLKLVDWQYGQLKTSGGEVSFSAMLKASKDDNDKFRIVVLANVRELTYAKLGDGQFEAYKSAGKNYDFIVGLLETSVPSYAALGLKGVPMWGELQDPVKLVNNTTNEYDMDLLRSLARIDVGTNSNPQYSAEGQITGWTALTNFSLEEVRVYNAQTHYALTARPNYNFNDKKVNTYTIPATSSTDSSPRIYSDNGQDENLISRTAGKGYALTGNF